MCRVAQADAGKYAKGLTVQLRTAIASPKKQHAPHAPLVPHHFSSRSESASAAAALSSASAQQLQQGSMAASSLMIATSSTSSSGSGSSGATATASALPSGAHPPAAAASFTVTSLSGGDAAMNSTSGTLLIALAQVRSSSAFNALAFASFCSFTPRALTWPVCVAGVQSEHGGSSGDGEHEDSQRGGSRADMLSTVTGASCLLACLLRCGLHGHAASAAPCLRTEPLSFASSRVSPLANSTLYCFARLLAGSGQSSAFALSPQTRAEPVSGAPRYRERRLRLLPPAACSVSSTATSVAHRSPCARCVLRSGSPSSHVRLVHDDMTS